MSKLLYILFVMLLILLSLSVNASLESKARAHFNISTNGSYTVHNLHTNQSYPTIQEAIDSPLTLDGHTIRVEAGIYVENVVVYKQLNLTGDGERITEIRAANSSRHTIEVVSSNVDISKFNITGATEALLQASGIYVHAVENVSISHNHIVNNHYGIHLTYSNNTVIDSNVVYSNWYNIYLSVASNYNTIVRNTAYDSRYGVVLWMWSHNNFVFNNMLHNNGRSGISIGYSKFNTIFSNYIAHNRMGIELQQPSMYNVISANTVHSNYEYGVNMGTYAASNNNTVYHNNIINNTIQAYDLGFNVWNHYYPLGGNYWDDYTGSDLFGGPHQNESTSDGIGDSPYIINSNNTDYYPLMNLYIAGDISRDGKVDMKDVALAAAAFGSYPGHPRWNPLADLTGQQILPDDRVDIIDLILIVKHFGQGQP